MLCGEHAVLCGFSAISIAITQRIQATFSKNNSNDVNITSKFGKVCLSQNDIRNNAQCAIPDWCQIIIFLLKQYNIFGLRIEITSNIDNYGFGSSGAIFSCISCGLQIIKNSQIEKYDLLKKTLKLYFKYYKNKDFKPSGIDVATSILGGMIYYYPSQNVVKNIDYNAFKAYNFFAIWTGHKTATNIAKNIADKATNSMHIYKDIGNIVETIYHLLLNNNTTEIIKQLDKNQALLTKLNLVDNDTSNILHQCRQQNVACKISGSGLGDCVIAICKKNQPFAIKGYIVKQIDIDSNGLTYEIE